MNTKTETSPPVSSYRVALLLLFLDLFGLLLFFNIAHYYFMGNIPDNLFLSKKMLMIVFSTFIIFYILDLYTLQSKVIELATIARTVIGVGIVGWLMATLIYVAGPQYMGGVLRRAVLTYGLVPFFLWTAIWRYVLGRWLKTRRKAIQWLVVIDSETLTSFFEDIYSDALNFDYGSFLFLINSIPESLPHVNGRTPFVAGSWDSINMFVDKNMVSGVIVATKRVPENLLHDLTRLKLEGIKIYDLNDFYERYLTRVPVFHLKSGWLALSSGFDLLHDLTGWRIKRMMDIFLAVSIIILTAPVFILCFICIRLESRGPALYKQMRVGYNAKQFILYKFRTMYDDSKDKNIYTQQGDKRITKIGRYLRNMRIDELPQMYNVLKGEMSLIGPRAEWIECVKRYENVIPFYHYRHLVKPGITGWAQVLFPYGASVEDARIKLQYDLYYIKNYSVILDMVIILKTVRVVIFGKGR
ncbi:MAG: sugar transferase [Deltaproteobacteria bacterium]|nr:sugar transferase [Deltaproteobacteria bacterium]